MKSLTRSARVIIRDLCHTPIASRHVTTITPLQWRYHSDPRRNNILAYYTQCSAYLAEKNLTSLPESDEGSHIARIIRDFIRPDCTPKPSTLVTCIATVGAYFRRQSHDTTEGTAPSDDFFCLVNATKQCRDIYTAREMHEAFVAIKDYPDISSTHALLDALCNSLMHISESLSGSQLADMFTSLAHLKPDVKVFKALGLLDSALNKVSKINSEDIIAILVSLRNQPMNTQIIKKSYLTISSHLEKTRQPLSASQVEVLLHCTAQFDFVGNLTVTFFRSIGKQLRDLDANVYSIEEKLSIASAMEKLQIQRADFIANEIISPLTKIIESISEGEFSYACAKSVCVSVKRLPAHSPHVDRLLSLVASRLQSTKVACDVEQLLQCVASLRYHDASTAGVKTLLRAINDKLRYLKQDPISKVYPCMSYLRAIGGLADCKENTLVVDMLLDTFISCVRRYGVIPLHDPYAVSMALQGVVTANPRLRQHALSSIIQRLRRNAWNHPAIISGVMQAAAACSVSQCVSEDMLNVIDNGLTQCYEQLQISLTRTDVNFDNFDDAKHVYIRLEMFLYFNQLIPPAYRIRFQRHSDAFHRLLLDDRWKSHYKDNMAQSSTEKRLVHAMRLLLKNYKQFSVRELCLLHGFDADIVITNIQRGVVHNIEIDGIDVHRELRRTMFAQQRDEYLFKKFGISVHRISIDIETSLLPHNELLRLASKTLNDAGILRGDVLRRALKSIETNRKRRENSKNAEVVC